MVMVAVVAVELAFITTPIGSFVLVFEALGSLVIILSKLGRLTRARASAWVFSAYPLMLVGCSASGLVELHLPDGSGQLGEVLFVGTAPAFFLSLAGVVIEADRAVRAGPGRGRTVAGLALFALLSWIGLLILAMLIIPPRFAATFGDPWPFSNGSVSPVRLDLAGITQRAEVDC